MATLILELRNAQESELTLFLVEEPEAHLHPQLQAVMLDYLQEQAKQSIRDDTAQRAGRIQIVATTHSPNLASSVGVENVVVLRSQTHSIDLRSSDVGLTEADRGGESNVDTEDVMTPSTATIRATRTSALALADLALTSVELRKVNQYLDVTRSELLFARRVVLLEGIAEAVLFPVLADQCVYPGKDDRARDRRRAIRGCSIVNIGSVDFSPYVKLLLQQINGVRLVDQLVIVTDGDPQLPDLHPDEQSDEQEPQGVGKSDPRSMRNGSNADDSAAAETANAGGYEDAGDVDADVLAKSSNAGGGEPDGDVVLNRASDLYALIKGLGASDVANVVEAKFTLEADLMEPTEFNSAILGAAFVDQKPRSATIWSDLVASASPAEAMYRKLRKSKKFLAKGQFAHDVAHYLKTTDHSFVCPRYLAEAIRIAATT